MTEQTYIEYLAHMLDESCNEKGMFGNDIDEDEFELTPLGQRKHRISGSGAAQKPRAWKKATLEELKGMSREDAVKKGIDQDMWLAAQLPFPEEDKHGKLGGCEIVEGTDRSTGNYLKVYYVKGYYEDATDLEVGPITNRKVAIHYINLHKISVKAKEWEKFKTQLDSFEKDLAKRIDIQNSAGNSDDDDVVGFKIAKFPDEFAVVDVIKLSDGYYLRKLNSNEKLGPFASQNIAQNYANAHKYDKPGTAFSVRKASDGKFYVYKKYWSNIKQDVVEKNTGKSFSSEEEAKKAAIGQGYSTELKIKDNSAAAVAHISYSIFVFEYEMAGIDCMDIVIAETKESAMKLFATQWKSFDNSKVIRSSFSSESDLEKELMTIRIKNINIFEISKEELPENIDVAREIGNPMTNPELKSRCRNPRCQYILGPDMKSGRVPVTIRQDFERRQKDNYAQKRVKPGQAL